MIDTTSAETHEPSRYGGFMRSPLPRFPLRLTFWVFGMVSTLSGVFCLAMLVIVPAFSLQNEVWNRPDSPFTLLNGVCRVAMGGIAIYGALGSNRRRVVITVFAFIAFILDALYELGFFDA